MPKCLTHKRNGTPGDDPLAAFLGGHRNHGMMSTIARIVVMVFKSSRMGAVYQVTATLLGSLLPILVSVLWRNILNVISYDFNIADGDLIRSFILFALIGGVSVSFYCFTEIVDTYFRYKMSLNMQRIIHGKSKKLPLTYYEFPRINDIIKRASGTFYYGPAVGIVLGISYAVSMIISLVASLVLLWNFHYLLALIFIPLSIPYILKFYLNKLHIDLSVRTSPQKREADVYRSYFTKYEYSKETKALNLNDYFLDKWRKTMRRIKGDEIRTNIKAAVIETIIDTLDVCGYGLSLFLSIYLIGGNRINLGEFGAVIMLIGQIKNSSSRMWDTIGELHGTIALVDKGFECLDLIEDTKTETVVPPLLEGIHGENLSFTYPQAEQKVLEDITIDIKPGEIAAFVGPNGAGKSTLAKVLLGLYTPDTGKVEYDRINIAPVVSPSLYKNVSAVFQDFNHYYLTIRENIGISDAANIQDAGRIRAAIREAGDNDFIKALPDGIETLLGKEYGGVELSGGQWQQLAISRGYFKESRLIVLDEPSSALDPFKEAQVYENFKKLCKNKIGIIITHRLGAAALADRIFLIEKGRISEQGSHRELCDLKGRYREMFEAQAGMYT